jgi:hypothetical protein
MAPRGCARSLDALPSAKPSSDLLCICQSAIIPTMTPTDALRPSGITASIFGGLNNKRELHNLAAHEAP